MASYIKLSQTCERPFCCPAPKWPGARTQARLHAADTGAAVVQQKPDAVVSDIPSSTIVVGGGPCGLTTAMSLADIGYRNIEVWDSRARPEPSNNEYWGCTDRSYNIGLVERGQAVLRQMGGLWASIEGSATPQTTRQQWSPQNPEGKTAPAKPDPKVKFTTQVLQRDRLVSCMLEHIDQEYIGKIRVKHHMGVEGLSVDQDDRVSLKWVHTGSDGGPAVNGASQRGVAMSDFVVGADGAGSKVLAALEEQNLGRVRNKQLQELAKNTRVYKTVMMPSPEGEDDSSTTFSERSAGGRVLESLPTVEGAVSLVHRK